MQLVADGRLDLDAPVQNTLPWFSIGSAWPDAGPVIQLESEKGETPRVRFSGWIFDRVAE